MVKKNRNFQFNRFYCIAIPKLWYANIITPVLKLSNTCFPLGWFMVFNVVFIMVVSFIDGGNWSTRRNHRQTLSHNVVSSTPRHEQDTKLR